jgi:molecular chaperone GrpE
VEPQQPERTILESPADTASYQPLAAAAVPEEVLEPSSVDQLVVAVGEVAKQVADLQSLFVRRLADDRQRAALYETTQEQVRELTGLLQRRDLSELITELLGVLDLLEDPQLSLELALGARDELFEVLRRRGLSRVEVTGEFQPAVHRGVATVAASESIPSGQVAGVVRQGYRLGDRMLRPAQVVVATGPRSNPSSQGETGV